MSDGTLSVAGYGSRTVLAISLSYGISVVASEDQSRNSRAWYPASWSQGRFTLAVTCMGYAEYVDLNNWLALYMYLISDPDSSISSAPMRVTVPALSFNQQGYLLSGVEYGDTSAHSEAYAVSLSFQAIDDVTPNYSSAIMAAKDPIAETFYPSGTQASGAAPYGTASIKSAMSTLMSSDNLTWFQRLQSVKPGGGS